MEFNVKVKSALLRNFFLKMFCLFRYAFIKIRFPFRLLIPYGARDFRSATQQAAFSLLANCRQRAVQIVAGSASSVEHDPQRALRKRGRNKMPPYSIATVSVQSKQNH